MKRFFLAALFLALPVLSAKLPDSIELEAGNLLLRLDGRKVWNINSIKWNSRLYGVDGPNAHYGMVYQPQGSKYWIGSGHRESGISEQLASLKITVDGKEVVPVAKQRISGKKIQVDKVSYVTDFVVNYSFTVEKNRLDEKIVIRARKAVKVNFMYCFMHPWDPRFTRFCGINKDGSKKEYTFRSDDKSPMLKMFPVGIWYEPGTGLGCVSVMNLEKGGKNAYREVWDRRMYRKDYFVPFVKSVFTVDNELVCSASTGFFIQKDTSKWIADGVRMAAVLGKKQ